MNEKYQLFYNIFKQDIERGLYDKSLVAFIMQMGRISAYLELSDFTEVERDNEENKLRELSNSWEKRYYSKEEK
jgi:hypothetical protein|nr:MAG TPA: hypothetical protein [Caudoviricetes sp.]